MNAGAACARNVRAYARRWVIRAAAGQPKSTSGDVYGEVSPAGQGGLT